MSGYAPEDPADLDYPAKLEAAAAAQQQQQQPDGSSSILGGESEASEQLWYPAVQNALVCLSKIYPMVDPPIFTGLALVSPSVPRGIGPCAQR